MQEMTEANTNEGKIISPTMTFKAYVKNVLFFFFFFKQSKEFFNTFLNILVFFFLETIDKFNLHTITLLFQGEKNPGSILLAS